MNPFYRKPKPETMKTNREIARTQYKEEMQWLKDNLDILTKTKNKFMIEMYTILNSIALWIAYPLCTVELLVVVLLR